MKALEPKKIAYLFGAGATHAEIHNLDPDFVEQKKKGLLVSHVSSRVIEKARGERGYLSGVEMVSGTRGSLNIELLISLIENSKIYGWERKTRRLKKLVQEDIEKILSKSLTRRFYLHKALFELHTHAITKNREELIGLISLNYDDVLDSAFSKYCGCPNYCFCLKDKQSSDDIPLLKLHGSFNWKRQKIRGRKRTIEIIPLGSTKNYLHAPYGFIWNRALEVLIGCDTLRVIGCSLSPNDVHLIDLLFKAHLEKGKDFDIEIISSEETGEAVRESYGFFPGVKTLSMIEGTLVPDKNPPNAFKTWLRYKSLDMLGEDKVKLPGRQTWYLKKVIS